MDDVLRNRMDIDGIVSRLVLNDEHIYVEGPHPDYWNSKVGYEMISCIVLWAIRSRTICTAS
ncbi:MAG: hypothetical protein ACLR0U_32865 [Enterocloster clostridioformis]